MRAGEKTEFVLLVSVEQKYDNIILVHTSLCTSCQWDENYVLHAVEIMLVTETTRRGGWNKMEIF